MELKVVGVTKGNRQEVIRSVIDSYVEKGKLKSFEGLSDEEIINKNMSGTEFEDQVLKGIASLEKETDNPHDPNAIKVMLNDAYGKKHHVGYIAKEQTAEVSDLLKRSPRIDVEFTGGKYKQVDKDDDDKEYITEEELTTGVALHLVDVVEYVENNPVLNKVLEKGDGTRKTKILNRLGCGLLLFIVFMIIIIIFV